MRACKAPSSAAHYESQSQFEESYGGHGEVEVRARFCEAKATRSHQGIRVRVTMSSEAFFRHIDRPLKIMADLVRGGKDATDVM